MEHPTTNLSFDASLPNREEQAPVSDPASSQHPTPKIHNKIGFNCHQCRQGGKKFVATCTNVIGTRRCKKHYCVRCLFNRYFLVLQEMSDLHVWKCFQCRGACNCSNCRESRGEKPTGRFAPSGIPDPAEMLNAAGNEVAQQNLLAQTLPDADQDAASKPSMEDDDHSFSSLHKGEKKEEICCNDQDLVPAEDPKELEIPLPLGSILTKVGQVEIPAEEVGNALQFTEFSYTFGEMLEMEQGQVESILREIMEGPDELGTVSSLVQYQINLLNLIEDSQQEPLTPTNGDKCWIIALNKCIRNSGWAPTGLAELNIDTTDGYGLLGFSEKLKILVFLCDRALETAALRKWIHDENLKSSEIKREEWKSNRLKRKTCDQIEEPITPNDGVPLSSDEQEPTFSQIKAESVETLEANPVVPQCGEKPNALRNQPVFADAKGNLYWRFKGYNNSNCLFLQDNGNEVNDQELWFSFDEAETEIIDKHVLSQRVKRRRRRKALEE